MSSLLHDFSGKEKRTIVLIAAGGAVWLGCCAAAYVAWQRQRNDSFLNDRSPSSSSYTLASKMQKTQFIINELRKINEEMTALRQDVNGVKVLVRQLRRDIADVRTVDNNHANNKTVNNEFHAVQSGTFVGLELGGYTEDDESELEFRSAKSSECPSRCKSPTTFLPVQKSSSVVISGNDDQSPSILVASFESSQLLNTTEFQASSSKPVTLVSSEMLSIDEQLDGTDDGEKREALRRLEELHSEDSDNPEIMWRLGRALYYESELVRADGNAVLRRDMAYRAKDLCFEALSQLSESGASAVLYKWCALTLGNLQEFESISNKIKQGYEFRALIEKAIELDPNDPLSHYLLGRWFYGCYQLTWYERKIASTLFAEPPSATIDEALGEFLKCSELLNKSGQTDWKENCLYIAKCYIEKRDNSGQVNRWLKSGQFLPDIDEESRLAGQEITKLLAQYGGA